MPFIKFNPTASPERGAEIVDESTGLTVAFGYLELATLPTRAGDRLGSIVFVATDVPEPTIPPEHSAVMARYEDSPFHEDRI